jgi:predicted  nucleic acid-binding Zn-ribbon protein
MRNQEELNKAVDFLLSEANSFREFQNQNVNNHSSIYDEIETVQTSIVTGDQKFDAAMAQIDRDREIANIDRKLFQRQIVEQNERMVKLENQSLRHQRNIEENQRSIEENQRNIEEQNRKIDKQNENISKTIEVLLLSIEDLKALRRDYNQLHDSINRSES